MFETGTTQKGNTMTTATKKTATHKKTNKRYVVLNTWVSNSGKPCALCNPIIDGEVKDRWLHMNPDNLIID